MKIQFGTPATVCHVDGVFVLGWTVFAISWLSGHLQTLLGESEESILRSRGLNVSDTSTFFSCDLPYDDCRCLVLNKSENSDNCITDAQLVGSRILPLVSFALQIYLVKVLFSVTADHRHVFIYVLWTASILTFVGMTISIHWNSCYHAYITLTLIGTGALLYFLSMYNLAITIDRIPSSSRRNKVNIVRNSKVNHNASRAWQGLP